MSGMAEATPVELGKIQRLSKGCHARPLPSLDGKPGVTSCYMKEDVPQLELTQSEGIVDDKRVAPSHFTRERDVLFASASLLRLVRGFGTDDDVSGQTIGQNVTLGDAAHIEDWCVGDLIQLGNSVKVRVTSCRRPCPKNNNVHGAGAEKRMDASALGGIFGTVIANGTLHVGDTVTLLERPLPDWTCTRVHISLYGSDPSTDLSLLRQIASLPFLEGPHYKDLALRRVQRAEAAAPSMPISAGSQLALVAGLIACAAAWKAFPRASAAIVKPW